MNLSGLHCDPSVFDNIPLFSLLGEEERQLLAAQVEIRTFHARQSIFKAGDPGGQAYVVLTGHVHLSMIDEDGQELVMHQADPGDFFGMPSMLEDAPHQTSARALEDTRALEIDRADLAVLLKARPLAGLDMLTMVGRQFHETQQLVRQRATRNFNLEFEERETMGARVADAVARFGGSWSFILMFGVVLISYASANVLLAERAWDPYPFILLNLFLSMLAALQAPVIMMSQNRQEAKDRLRSELDYRINLKAELEISRLLSRTERLEELLEDVRERLPPCDPGA